MEIDIQGTIRNGNVGAYKDLARRMCQIADREPGTLRYEWYASDDGHFRNVDVYASSEAFVSHMGNLEKAGALGLFVEVMDVEVVAVFGSPSHQAREKLRGFGPVYYDLVAQRSSGRDGLDEPRQA